MTDKANSIDMGEMSLGLPSGNVLVDNQVHELKKTIDSLNLQLQEKTTKIQKLNHYIASLEADGDRLSDTLVRANSYRNAMDFNFINVPIFSVTPSLVIENANQSFYEMTGLNRAEIQKQLKCSEVLNCPAFRKNRCLLKEAFESKTEVCGYRCNYINPLGKKFKLTVNASPIINIANHEILGGIEAFSEVIEDTQAKYLIFTLANHSMGVNIASVKEILPFVDITTVRNMPEHVRGIINLRGQVVPILDLNLRLNLNSLTTIHRNCVVILEIQNTNGKKNFGIIVDRVKDIITLNNRDVEFPSSVGFNGQDHYISGIARIGNRVEVLLNIEKLFGSERADPNKTMKG